MRFDVDITEQNHKKRYNREKYQVNIMLIVWTHITPLLQSIGCLTDGVFHPDDLQIHVYLVMISMSAWFLSFLLRIALY